MRAKLMCPAGPHRLLTLPKIVLSWRSCPSKRGGGFRGKFLGSRILPLAANVYRAPGAAAGPPIALPASAQLDGQCVLRAMSRPSNSRIKRGAGAVDVQHLAVYKCVGHEHENGARHLVGTSNALPRQLPRNALDANRPFGTKVCSRRGVFINRAPPH